MSDLIDRQALLKQIDIDSDGEPGYYGDTWKFIDTIKNMPNVHDLPKDTDTISRAKAIEALDEIEAEVAEGFGFEYEKWRKYFCDLPPARPKRGKWIHISEEMWKCDQCGEISCCSPNFCPDCGADMREVTT